MYLPDEETAFAKARAVRRYVRDAYQDAPDEPDAMPALHFECYDREENKEYHVYGIVKGIKLEIGTPASAMGADGGHITLCLTEPPDNHIEPIYGEMCMSTGDEAHLDFNEILEVQTHEWVVELAEGILEPVG